MMGLNAAGVRWAIQRYLDTGKRYYDATPSEMAAAAKGITGRHYTRNREGLQLAVKELAVWIEKRQSNMNPTLPEIMKAMDDLETVFRKVIDVFEPFVDADEHTARRALAVLHAHIRELNK